MKVVADLTITFKIPCTIFFWGYQSSVVSFIFAQLQVIYNELHRSVNKV